jgi:hypothetical protein
MSDLFDTTQVRDDAAHWDDLAERVAAHAARRSNESSFAWLAHSRTSWVAASLLLAGALTVMVLSTDNSVSSFSTRWTQAFAPADSVGGAMILPDGPPAIGALLLGVRGGV